MVIRSVWERVGCPSNDHFMDEKHTGFTYTLDAKYDRD